MTATVDLEALRATSETTHTEGWVLLSHPDFKGQALVFSETLALISTEEELLALMHSAPSALASPLP